MADLKHAITEYFLQTLGAEVSPVTWRKDSGLAHYLTERYRFYQADILGQSVLFMVDGFQAEESPVAIRKHITQVRSKCDSPIVYVRERVTAYNRKRLIEQRVPFVVPGNQMYLPDLGIDLREHFRKQTSIQTRFSPAAQAVVIHALLRNENNPLTAAEVATELGYSSMTLGRAFDEMEAAEIAKSKVVGRVRLVSLTGDRRAIWERAQPMLKSPVKARHFVQGVPRKVVGLKAGLSALALYTMLADPANPVLALSREQWATMKQRGGVVMQALREPDSCEIETWAYVPRPFRNAELVDPLSLALSLRQSADERTEQAVARMLEELAW